MNKTRHTRKKESCEKERKKEKNYSRVEIFIQCRESFSRGLRLAAAKSSLERLTLLESSIEKTRQIRRLLSNSQRTRNLARQEEIFKGSLSLTFLRAFFAEAN